MTVSPSSQSTASISRSVPSPPSRNARLRIVIMASVKSRSAVLTRAPPVLAALNRERPIATALARLSGRLAVGVPQAAVAGDELPALEFTLLPDAHVFEAWPCLRSFDPIDQFR